MSRVACCAIVIYHIPMPGITETDCQNTGDLIIRCPSGETLTIVSGFFGRARPGSEVCPTSAGNDKDTSCAEPDAENKIRSLCDGQSRCFIPTTVAFFGHDPCPLTYKYVEVTYTCGGKAGGMGGGV